MPQLSSDDLTVIKAKLNLGEGSKVDALIGSSYMPYDSPEPPPHQEIKKLIDYAREKRIELLLGCDANSHHVAWGSSDINQRGESLHEFILSNNLIILNRGSEPTFMDSRRQEVIDITICTEGMARLVKDWRVSNEPSGSDHRQICLTLLHENVIKWIRNPRKTNWDGYRQDLASSLAGTMTRLNGKQDLEIASQRLSNAIITAFEANCPLKEKSHSTKVPWWNKELEKLRSEVRCNFNRAKRYGTQNLWEAFRSSQREYSKAITKAKRKSWKLFCESIESAPEASRLNKILSSEGCSQLGSLKRTDGTYTECIDDTLKHLMEIHFPGFSEDIRPPNRCNGIYKPKNWALAARIVYTERLEWAIKSFEPYKSPGLDGIYPALLQEGINGLKRPLINIYRASIALRHVPVTWGETRVVFIPKPGRNGHILAKDFRPISLGSFLMKTLERLVDGYLKSGPLIEHPIASNQYAYTEGRSTETALHHLVGGIEAQLANKGYALGVFLDIEGAFDSTSYSVIRDSMTNHGSPSALVDWVGSMLTSRILTVSYAGTDIRGYPAKGCPQGGVLSPLLWCMVVDDLLRTLQEEGITAYGYADDVAIVVRGNFLQPLKELMQRALRITQRWCMAKGLTVNPSKTNAMIFTRKYKPQEITPLSFWGSELVYTSSVKYLGVRLDPKLNWKQHLNEKRNKFYTSLWACRKALGKTWGMQPKVALWIYRAVLLPRLTYAAVIWWPRVGTVESRNLLRSIQGNYLRAAVGAMRTTPTEALEVALCVPPLNQFIVYTARLTAYRLKCQGEWRSGDRGHSGLKFLHERPFVLKQDKITKTRQVIKSFSVHIPERKDIQKLLDRPNTDTWYTDGSGANDRFGAGIFCHKLNHRESIPMGKMATVFQAEVLAILRCVKLQISKGTNNTKILICCDSKAAIQALAKSTTDSSLIRECVQELNSLGSSNEVTLMWIPGHQGIPGNEIADELAKRGTLEDPPEQVVGVPFAFGKNKIREWMDKEHQLSWSTGAGCRQAKLLMKQTTTSRTKELLSMSKQRLRLSIGLLTGHVALQAHLYNLKLAERKTCRLCEGESEDSIHILCECPALMVKRHRYWGQLFCEPKDLQEVRVSSLCLLAENAGLGLRP